MDDILNEFVVEAKENLGSLDNDMVMLEKDPQNLELIGNIFRSIHTIKGACGFIGLPRLEKVAHSGENVLGKFRDGEIEVTPEAVTLILECMDTINGILDELTSSGQEPDGDDSDLIAKLDAIAEGGSVSSGNKSNEDIDLEELPTEEELEIVEEIAPKKKKSGGKKKASPAKTKTAKIDDTPKIEEPEVKEQPVKNNPAPAPKSQDAKPANPTANQSIRVHVSLLENLITTVSELVLTRNQLLQLLQEDKTGKFETPLQRLNHITSDLQNSVMKTRMQPIGQLWSSLPRLIRDLEQDLGKKIELVLEGEETELDRQVLELIKDPLTHMVRNAVDHGIENPSDRKAAGKPTTGHLKLNAFHAGGHIVIEISDDGKGLNSQKIKEKIVEKGLLTEDKAEALNPKQLYQYIFHPGFSTAAKVTNVSGRGVGMDVVRNNIEKIGGSIEVKTKEGEGTVFIITIPLTLAIVSGLIVAAGGNRYVMPQASILELVRISRDSEFSVEYINDTPVLRIRNKLLQLISLEGLLHGKPFCKEECIGKYILIVNYGSTSYGIVVDAVHDTQEIVVKPVSPVLQKVPVYAGNTILGDGTVSMILDPKGILLQGGEESLSEAEANDDSSVSGDAETTNILIFKAGFSHAPKAIPLTKLTRLEEIDPKTIEYANNSMVIQYRNSLMQLFKLDNSNSIDQEKEVITVLVFFNGKEYVGLVVDELIDIAEERIELKSQSADDGIYGSAVIRGKTTEIIDVEHYVSRIRPDWCSESATKARENTESILIYSKNGFFRNIVENLLKMEGLNVIATHSPKKAADIIESNKRVGLVIYDYEDLTKPLDDGILVGIRGNGTNFVILTDDPTQLYKNEQIDPAFQVIEKADRRVILQTILNTIRIAEEEAA